MAVRSIHSCHSTRIKLDLLDESQACIGVAISPPKIHSFEVLHVYMFKCEHCMQAADCTLFELPRILKCLQTASRFFLILHGTFIGLVLSVQLAESGEVSRNSSWQHVRNPWKPNDHSIPLESLHPLLDPAKVGQTLKFWERGLAYPYMRLSVL